MCKQDLALNNLQGLIFHKTKPKNLNNTYKNQNKIVCVCVCMCVCMCVHNFISMYSCT